MKIVRITKKSDSYPGRLKHLPKPPGKLRTIGAELEELLEMPTLGIVGSRKVTGYGKGVTEDLADALARAGVCIVSGLALGVDSIAHLSALKAKGKTIAVLPSGIKTIYPATHRGLARNIVASGGALVSEYDDDFRPRKETFIERNRIIAALSDALLVTEAAEKSGSLHTANFVLELGKPVMAVPGNITSAISIGTNNLLKTGAVMVTTEADIMQVLGIEPLGTQEKMQFYGDNEHETAILNLLSTGISSGEELLHASELDIQLFQQTLSMLEIKGAIASLGNNHWHLK